jgi:hypothetical protein
MTNPMENQNQSQSPGLPEGRESGGESQSDTQERLLQFFTYAHLPPELQEISRMFADLAHWTVEALPRNPERTVALRKLMEAKDCAVRAKLFK